MRSAHDLCDLVLPDGGCTDPDESRSPVEQDVVGVDELRDEERIRWSTEQLKNQTKKYFIRCKIFVFTIFNWFGQDTDINW